MTADDFRGIALSLPEAVESSHMGHADFRVRNKIFATLGYPDDSWGMVKLKPEEQSRMVREQPQVFVPVKGAWGKRGCTCVQLKPVTKSALRAALFAAWLSIVPKRLAEEYEADT